jgi:hypothetical protein
VGFARCAARISPSRCTEQTAKSIEHRAESKERRAKNYG